MRSLSSSSPINLTVLITLNALLERLHLRPGEWLQRATELLHLIYTIEFGL